MSKKPKPRKKKYFPNNYNAVKAAPHQWFLPIPFDEFMDWKIGGYEIPSSINCGACNTYKGSRASNTNFECLNSN